MNKIAHIIALLFAILLPRLLFGQENIEVLEQTVKMSQGEQPAYIVKIPQANYDEVLKDWTKIIRQNTKSKFEELEHEMIIRDTQIPEISNNPMNIYSAVINVDSSVKVVAVFEIDSLFFSFAEEQPDLYTEKTHHHIKNFMREFAVDQYKYAVKIELSDAEKSLQNKNKELKDLEKEKENLLKEVKENEQYIKSSEDLISSFEKDSERKLSEINSKKEAIAGLSNDPELASQAKDQLKALEKEKKNIGGKLEKEQKNIVKSQANIEESNRYIEDNLEKQAAKKVEIASQEDIVEAIKTKLQGIK